MALLGGSSFSLFPLLSLGIISDQDTLRQSSAKLPWLVPLNMAAGPCSGLSASMAPWKRNRVSGKVSLQWRNVWNEIPDLFFPLRIEVAEGQVQFVTPPRLSDL